MRKKNIPDDDGDNGRELIEIKMQEKDLNAECFELTLKSDAFTRRI